MATRGYNSYRGRVSTGRIVLIVVLVLILLGAVGYLAVQNYLSTTRRGRSIWSCPGAGMTTNPRRIRRRWRMWTSTGWNRRAR